MSGYVVKENTNVAILNLKHLLKKVLLQLVWMRFVVKLLTKNTLKLIIYTKRTKSYRKIKNKINGRFDKINQILLIITFKDL